MEIKEQFAETLQVGLIIESDELTFVVRVHTVTVFEVTPDIDLIVDTYGIKHICPFRGTGTPAPWNCLVNESTVF